MSTRQNDLKPTIFFYDGTRLMEHVFTCLILENSEMLLLGITIIFRYFNPSNFTENIRCYHHKPKLLKMMMSDIRTEDARRLRTP